MKEREVNCEIYNENKGISTDEKAVVLFDKNVVEKAIVNFLQETIAPALQPYADVLIQQCKEAIEKIVTQSVIERVEAEVHTENRTRIFERVQERLRDEVTNHFPDSDISKAEAVEKAKLIQKWIDGIGEIREEDEELSAIWEGWFIEMNKETQTTDQKRALDIMKTLSAEEAKLMLEIKEKGYIKFSLFSKTLPSRKHYYSHKEKIQYLVSQLLKRELIVKTNVINIMTIAIALGVFSYAAILFYFFGSSIKELYSHAFALPITVIAILFISAFSSLWLFQKRYRLTWIGEKIVSYAKKPQITKQKNIEKEKNRNFVVINDVKWANHNLGTSSPTEFGGYYTWEEAKRACQQGWRLPTEQELKSLIDAGSTWETINGVVGRTFGIAPNQIFLPAAGYRDERGIHYRGVSSDYWSDTENSSTDAHYLYFHDRVAYTNSFRKTLGFSVRCVTE